MSTTTAQEERNFGSVHAVWLVARREIVTRVRSKSFIYSTVAILVVIAGYIGLMQATSGDTNKQHVAFSPNTATLAEPYKALATQAGFEPVITTVLSTDDGRSAVRSGKLDAFVASTDGRVNVVVKDDPDAPAAELVGAAVQQQASAGVIQQLGATDLLQQQVASAGPTIDTLQVKDPLESQRLYLAYAIAMLLYVALLIFGIAVAQGVVEEKSNRVVELLLSTYKPWHVMTGKIIGVGTAGLLQLTIIAAAGLTGAVATDLLHFNGQLLSTVVISLVWFVFGFVFFSTMLAAAGALVSRQEEVNSVTQPIIFLIAVPFILSLTLLQSNRNGVLVEVLSMVPPFAPVLMPERIALTDAAVWQIAIAFSTTALATAGLIAIASRIYANAVLRTGARVSLRKALQAD